MNELSLIVHTCDEYSFLWENFLKLFDKYWDTTIPCDKYFLSQTNTPTHPEFVGITAGNVIFSDRLLYALDKIKTKYVLTLQDDYFIRRTLDKAKFDEYISFMNQNNAQAFGIKEMSRYYSLIPYEQFKRKTQHSDYTASMQATIWDVEFLKQHLRHGENIWQFEIDGTHRINRTEHRVFCDILSDPWYQEVMRKGMYVYSFYDLAEKENLTYEIRGAAARA